MNPLDNYPMLAARRDTPFVADLSIPFTVNGNPMSKGVWNMLITKRDLSMWTKFKMKPHRHWKVGQVKAYFGIKGNGQKLLDQFLALVAEVDAALGDDTLGSEVTP